MADLLETLVGTLASAMNETGGAECDYGCAPDDVEYWTGHARSLNASKRVVAVKNWSWWDLEFPQETREKFDAMLVKSNIQPVYLFSYNVLFDTSRKFQPGNWVRSTALVKLHDNCIFETRNSLYLMVGPGTRKLVDIALAHSLF